VTDTELLELRRLATAVEAQAAEMAELRRALLDKADRRTGARLVPALDRLMQGRPFALAEAAARALNESSPAAGVVVGVIDDTADGDGGFRGFGRLLTRLQGVRFGGLRLMPATGGRWMVEGGFSSK
jgi:hypothetical protein